MKAKIDGQWCIVIERGEYFTKVLTPFHEIHDVANNDIEDIERGAHEQQRAGMECGHHPQERILQAVRLQGDLDQRQFNCCPSSHHVASGLHP